MQTQVMVEGVVGIPWLEYRAGDGVESEQTFLSSFPFCIGRSSEAELQIDSSRVSRSHAHILQEEDEYRLRDLNSTNGTTINGVCVDDEPLTEGDIVGIADVEFVFHSSTSTDTSNVTQAMDEVQRPRASRAGCHVREIIRAVRQTHELTSRCRVAAPLETIVELEHGTTFGYESQFAASRAENGASEAESLVSAIPCALTQRLRRLHQLIVTESVIDISSSARIFLHIDPADLEKTDLLKGLRRLCRLVSEPSQLVLTLPVSLVGESVGFATMYARLRDLGLGLAYNDVLEGQSLVRRISATPGDYLKLSPTLIDGIEHEEDRKRHVRSIVQASRDLGCELIACGIGSEAEAMACLDLGCRFGQGGQFHEASSQGRVRSC